MDKKPNAAKIMIFCIYSLVLGAVAGVVIWVLLRIMSLGIDLLWVHLPSKLGIGAAPSGAPALIYSLPICIIGGLIIGLWQRKQGLLPDELPEVIAKVKLNGTYPYDKIHILAVSALLPLIFGGTLGPEAGLTGIIVALCYWIGDKLKYKGDELAVISEVGIAATLGVIFGAPLFGFVRELELDDELNRVTNPKSDSISADDKSIENASTDGESLSSKPSRKRLVSKPVRSIIYIFGIAGGMLGMKLPSDIFGGGSGLPRFEAKHAFITSELKFVIPLFICGIAAAIAYLIFEKLSAYVGGKLSKYRVASCIVAGIVLAVISAVVPNTMFSGEHQIKELMTDWEAFSVGLLVIMGIAKLFMTSFCINLGWRGGSIFPIIYSGVVLGYAYASATGMEPLLAVAMMCATVYGYISHQKLMVVAILLLCFPPSYILPILVCAAAASYVPIPKVLRKELSDEKI